MKLTISAMAASPTQDGTITTIAQAIGVGSVVGQHQVKSFVDTNSIYGNNTFISSGGVGAFFASGVANTAGWVVNQCTFGANGNQPALVFDDFSQDSVSTTEVLIEFGMNNSIGFTSYGNGIVCATTRTVPIHPNQSTSSVGFLNIFGNSMGVGLPRNFSNIAPTGGYSIGGMEGFSIRAGIDFVGFDGGIMTYDFGATAIRLVSTTTDTSPPENIYSDYLASITGA